MDTTRERHELDATGWQRGLYDDVQATFRAPAVNWIVRTLMANDPALTRFLWGQLKPTFETSAFGRYSVAFRAAALDAAADLPRHRASTLGLGPTEYAELRGQMATFDVVMPRLAVLFETVTRALDDDPVGEAFDGGRAATAPLPDWLDRNRGRPLTMTTADAAAEEHADLVADVRSVNGFGETFPSLYRCLLQWPDAFDRLWRDLRPLIAGDRFDEVRAATRATVSTFVDELPYPPRLSPTNLNAVGVDDETVTALRALFRRFEGPPVRMVIPAGPLVAYSVGVDGPVEWL